MFRQLDVDHDNKVDIDEFVNGAICLSRRFALSLAAGRRGHYARCNGMFLSQESSSSKYIHTLL